MKDFLLIANKNCITYKEIFPLIKENKMWLGFTVPEDFEQPEGFEKKSLKGLTRWFTNLVHSKRLEGIYCPQKYVGREDKYPVYDNYDAIEIGHYTKNGKWEGSLDELPYDYDGVMGVPITFLDQYSPEQFEIVGGTGTFELTRELGVLPISKGFISDYERCGGQRAMTSDTPLLAFYTPSGKAIIPYARILIRRKK